MSATGVFLVGFFITLVVFSALVQGSVGHGTARGTRPTRPSQPQSALQRSSKPPAEPAGNRTGAEVLGAGT